MRRLLRRVLRRLLRLVEPRPASPHDTAATIQRLRASGVRIGEGCAIYSESFSTEPIWSASATMSAFPAGSNS
jgi:hypothetical protein